MEEIIKILNVTNAIRKGHFLLASGLHSDTYIQCAQLLQYPTYTKIIAERLINNINQKIDVVIGPATGGIILSYELARLLKCRAIFAERENGKLLLRRNFEINKGEKVLICEDVITTGKTTQELIELVKEKGGKIIAVVAIVERTTQIKKFNNIKKYVLVRLNLKNYNKEACPLCKNGIELEKPGSKRASEHQCTSRLNLKL